MITFDVITVFPKLLKPFQEESLLKRAQKKKLLHIETHNLRDWTVNKKALRQARGNSSVYRRIDDRPFGGGLGMVMKIEPIFNAVQALKAKRRKKKVKVISFSPRGKKFTQAAASLLAKLDHIILICGRYEGIDERVSKYIADEEYSIGDYVLMGGEIPAMAVIEATARLIPGIIGKPEFLKERKLKKAFLEYPQYTRPETFIHNKGKAWKVPSILLSGNHAKIEAWRKKRGRAVA